MRRSSGLALVMLWAASIAVAQSPASTTADTATSIGLIVYAEGEEITILAGGVRRALDVASGEALGEPLFPGDQVSTGAATFAEIQLLTGTNIVRLSENTTVTLSELDPAGRTAIDMTFGRIRSRVERIAGGGRFEVRGATAVAGVRGTEFGYDQVLDPLSGTLTNAVYALEGEVEVGVRTPDGDDGPAEEQRTLVVAAGEAVVVGDGREDQPLEIVPIPEQTVRFWSARPFEREPAPPEALFVEFPDLAERVERAGRTLAPQLLEIAEAAAEAPVEPEPVPEAPEPEPEPPAPRVTVEEAPRDFGSEAEEVTTTQPRGAFLRTSGAVLVGAGLAADLAAAGLYFFGADLFDAWASFGDPLVTWLGIGGSGSIGLGVILSLVGELVR